MTANVTHAAQALLGDSREGRPVSAGQVICVQRLIQERQEVIQARQAELSSEAILLSGLSGQLDGVETVSSLALELEPTFYDAYDLIVLSKDL